MSFGFVHSYPEIFAARIMVVLGEAPLAPAAVLWLTGNADNVLLPLFGTVRTWHAAFMIVGLPGFIIAALLITVKEPRRRKNVSDAILVIGAANVLSGKLRKFVSGKEAIRIEHVLASCAVPSIFPAVEIGEDAYWDGLFSDNPPVDELIRPIFVGPENLAEEIWLIKINPTSRKTVPSQPDDIFDRRNQLEGNISLFQHLTHLEMLNDMLLGGAFRNEYLENLGIKNPIRIPKSFHNDPDKSYHIPCIEMSAEVQNTLDYEGKIDRGSGNIDMLIRHGREQARAFLDARAAAVGN